MTRTRVAVAVAGLIGMAASVHAQSPAAPTFSKEVAPILYQNCTSCHRSGEIGPMPLVSFNDARPWAKSIATRVTNGTMPPWHADPAHGEFLNDRRLSDKDRDTIVKWVSSGAPEGNPADMPKLPAFADGWQIGQPDTIWSMLEDYKIPATGTIEYKNFEVPTNLTEDKWAQAIEVRPGNRSVVHHVIVYMIDPKPAPRGPQPFAFAPGMRRPADAPKTERGSEPNDRPMQHQPTGWLSGFAPGQSVRIYQPGTALRVPAGATLIIQEHYTANGKDATDRTRIGIKWAKEVPKTPVDVATLQNANFVLPAGSSDTRVDAELTLNQDTTVWSILPHTHMRGKKWEVTATYPDGRSELILNVPKYDFNWQTDYIFKQPLNLPKGTKIRTSAWYDNSTANKANPDPKKDVYWGDQTWEEMQFTAITFSASNTPAKTASGGAKQ
jgi:mono/diheme cytochrome c family protein